MSNSVEVGCPCGGGNGELGVKVKDRVYGCRRQYWCAVMVLKRREVQLVEGIRGTCTAQGYPIVVHITRANRV
ncbi:hypothetical protein Hanom_Chr09g00850651 [Helianthus anomalus]